MRRTRRSSARRSLALCLALWWGTGALTLRAEAAAEVDPVEGEVTRLVQRIDDDLPESPEEAIRAGERALALLEETPDLSAEVTVRRGLARALGLVGRLDEALEQARAAVALAHRLEDRELESRCQQAVGHLYKDQSRFDLALEALHAALELADGPSSGGLRASLLLGIGNVHARTGDWERALEYNEQALDIAQRLDDQGEVASALNNIGIAYRNLERLDQALVYYHRALEIKQRLGDPADIARTLNNIGIIHAQRHEPGRALEFFQRALALKNEVGDRGQIASSLNNLGIAYGELGQPRLGEQHLSEAMQIREELGDSWGLASTLNDLASLHLAAGELDRAIEVGERSLDVATRIEARQVIVASLSTLARAHETSGNLARALHYQKLRADLTEEIFHERTSRALAELQARFELGEKDREIAQLNRDRQVQQLQLENERMLRWSSVVGALLLLALIVVLNRAYRLKARTTAELDAAYRRMEELANRDSLTGVLSRRAMLLALEDAGARCDRFGRPFTIVMADVDRFKAINDSHGHHVGDAVLAAIANLLASRTRCVDAVSRWGGDEFLVLLTETDLEGGVRLAERLREAVAEAPPAIDGRPLPVTLSYGVSMHDRAGSVEATIRRADEAMYAGKVRGGDCIRPSSGHEPSGLGST